MNRRRFLTLFSMATIGAVAAPAIPFGRVWSFPSKIIAPRRETKLITLDQSAGADWAFDVNGRVIMCEKWYRGRDGVIYISRYSIDGDESKPPIDLGTRVYPADRVPFQGLEVDPIFIDEAPYTVIDSYVKRT